MRISYRLTKPGEATVYLTDEQGSYFAVEPWRKQRAALLSHQWDGTTGGQQRGGRLLPNGATRSTSRRATRPATPPARPRRSRSGTAARPGSRSRTSSSARSRSRSAGRSTCAITVRNTGTAPIHSWGPRARPHVLGAGRELRLDPQSGRPGQAGLLRAARRLAGRRDLAERAERAAAALGALPAGQEGRRQRRLGSARPAPGRVGHGRGARARQRQGGQPPGAVLGRGRPGGRRLRRRLAEQMVQVGY